MKTKLPTEAELAQQRLEELGVEFRSGQDWFEYSHPDGRGPIFNDCWTPEMLRAIATHMETRK